MYFKHIFAFLISLNLAYPSFAQSKTAAIEGDCNQAVTIEANGKYVFKKSPVGHGNVLEYTKNPFSSIFYFTEENNSAWFTFTAQSSSILTFIIQPKDTLADLDFLLYEYTNANFCTDVKMKKIKPVRSNISRFNPSVKSITGLADEATQKFAPAGPGRNFSSSIKLKQGQRYYLVINESNDIQTPFKIQFKNKLAPKEYGSSTISGTLTDIETGAPVTDAKITIENEAGEIILETMTHSTTGKYTLKVPMPADKLVKSYVIIAEKKDYFYTEQAIKLSPHKSNLPINLVIPTLQKGRKIALHTILFYGNVAKTLPQSDKSLKRLLKLMKKNPTMHIEISGHTNGCSNGAAFSLQLSKQRAVTVKSYLVDGGIAQNRISSVGYGCSKMLYPITSSEELQQKNRRVEILVTDYTANP
tara:strand:- start:31758 stop:33005 length:1248 start_codon:yes stop_codon:yes gene_type:complete